MDAEITPSVKSLPFVSPSSPPPIDSSHIEVEEFGDFIGQDDAFDITGLSQKLSIEDKESHLADSSLSFSPREIDAHISNSLQLDENGPVELGVNVEAEFEAQQRNKHISDDEGSNKHILYEELNKHDEELYKNATDEESEHIEISESSSSDISLKEEHINKDSNDQFKINEISDNFKICTLQNEDSNNLSTLQNENSNNPIAEHFNFVEGELKENTNILPIASDNIKSATVDFDSDDEFDDFQSGYVETMAPISTDLKSLNNDVYTSETNLEKDKDLPLNQGEHEDCFNKSLDVKTDNISNELTECPEEIDDNLRDSLKYDDFDEQDLSKENLDFDHDFSDQIEEENLVNELRNKIDMAINDDDDDDDFGEFSSNVNYIKSDLDSPPHEPSIETVKKSTDSFAHFEAAFSENSFDGKNSTCKINEFDTYILKWIALEPCFDEEVKDMQSIQKLDEIVEGDAFIWHHLEDIDSSLALQITWQGTQAYKQFLASINVDARNILFGQKWSSSVPLFAQTLSFSPLTPDKTIGVSKQWSPVVSEDKTEEPLDSSKIAKDTKDIKIIPPVKFDWSSSGLTNPLDGPGLEKEILGVASPTTSSNEKICDIRSKGQTNATSPILEKILQGSNKTSSIAHHTPLSSLSLKVRNIVSGLPDLNYMKSKVLMFPIKGELDI